jgi:hypothetical protein
MAYSLKPTHETNVARVCWFIEQYDPYNALEALKAVEGQDADKLGKLIRQLANYEGDLREIAD